MAAHALTNEQKEEALRAVEDHGSVTAAAAALGLSRATFSHRYNAASREARHPSTKTVTPALEAKFWKDRCAKLETENATLQRIRKELFGLVDKPLSPPAWALESKKRKNADIPVLFTSDFQYGEVVKPAEINGLNAYDTQIAERRYRELIASTIDIAFNWRTQKEYAGIYYLRGGDAISGSIHEELRETNEIPSVLQVRDVAKLEAWGIKELADKFGKVHVASVGGNHGRCLEENTEVLTADGWKLAAEVSAEDRFATVDLSTGVSEFVQCENLTRFSERGGWRVSGHYRSELVTKEHKVPIRGALTPLTEVGDTEQAGAFDLYLVGPGSTGRAIDYLRLIAWTVFDGTVVDRRKHGESGFRLQFRLKKPRKVESLLSLLLRNAIEFTNKLDDSGVTTIRVYGETASSVGALTGAGKQKMLPKEFGCLGKQELAAVLEVISETDGRLIGKGGLEWSSVCRHNVDLIQASCALSGIPMRTKLVEKPSGYPNRRPIYISHIQPSGLTPRSACHRVRKTWLDEEMRFVGIQVKHGTLITRRDGRACVTGNTTIKPRFKTYTETNLEYLVACLLEWHFQNDKRVTFETPVSGELYFKIHDTRFLLTHGDQIGSRGGQGFIGPAATIMRGLKKTRDQYAAMNKQFDCLLIGHYHQYMLLPGCLVNSSLVGPSEFSVKCIRAEPEIASQTLFFVNQKWGLIEPRAIRLEEPGATW